MPTRYFLQCLLRSLTILRLYLREIAHATEDLFTSIIAAKDCEHPDGGHNKDYGTFGWLVGTKDDAAATVDVVEPFKNKYYSYRIIKWSSLADLCSRISFRICCFNASAGSGKRIVSIIRRRRRS
jgi:hypothetical protein